MYSNYKKLDNFLNTISSYDGVDFHNCSFVFSNEQINNCIIQSVSEDIDGCLVDFISLKIIDINSNYRKQKIFTNLILALENTRFPVLVEDVISPIVYDFLDNRGYIPLLNKKSKNNESEIHSLYLLYSV